LRNEIEKLGRITKTMLGFSDCHGFFTFNIQFNFGDSGAGMGGVVLGARDATVTEMPEREMALTAGGLVLIENLLSAVGADAWEDLVGKVCWVRGDGSKVMEIEAPDFVEHRGAFNIEKIYAEIKKKYPEE